MSILYVRKQAAEFPDFPNNCPECSTNKHALPVTDPFHHSSRHSIPRWRERGEGGGVWEWEGEGEGEGKG